MRVITKHALTGALVGAAALGVAATTNASLVSVSAEPLPATVSSVEHEQEARRAAEERATRSAQRKADEARKAEQASKAVAKAVAERNKNLAKTRAAANKRDAEMKAKQAARVKEQGYDPETATTPKEIGRQIAANKFGWTGSEFECYDKLIMSESRWIVDATNPSSGAYGIPQSLPAEKMATEGDDWRTNPATQITWGLKYVDERFGTPCSAWSFKQQNNWY